MELPIPVFMYARNAMEIIMHILSLAANRVLLIVRAVLRMLKIQISMPLILFIGLIQ